MVTFYLNFEIILSLFFKISLLEQFMKDLLLKILPPKNRIWHQFYIITSQL